MRFVILTLITALMLATSVEAAHRVPLRNICRIKGQEEIVLRGVGLIVGLNGTGEAGDGPTMRALARSLELLGNPVSQTGRLDDAAIEVLKKNKNVSMVMVEATIPATGARRGDRLDCYVSGVNGKSLVGGRLAFASLLGPSTTNPRVYATCQGPIQIDDVTQPMAGRVHDGCQMSEDVFTPFHKDGHMWLVIDDNHAGFQVADVIADKIRDTLFTNLGSSNGEYREQRALKHVLAVDARNVRVQIPDEFRLDPATFAARLLDLDIYEAEPEARVYINTKAGSITLSGDVEISDVVVSHRNMVVEIANPSQFVAVDPGGLGNPVSQGELGSTKLDRLVQALDALKVPADDQIEIIRGIDRLGALHAKLIID